MTSSKKWRITELNVEYDEEDDEEVEEDEDDEDDGVRKFVIFGRGFMFQRKIKCNSAP